MRYVYGSIFLWLLHGRKRRVTRGQHAARPIATSWVLLTVLLPALSCLAQEAAQTPALSADSHNTTQPVNWIYGAYIPKGAPIQALPGEARFKLYLRQTYTTPGIYVKS